MDIKLAAIDIDGTLLNPKREINKAVKDAVGKAINKGVKIVICTGRPTPGIDKYIHDLNLNQKEDYSITYNGALLRRTDTKEVLFQHELEHKDFLKLQKAANNAGVHFHVLHNDSIITLNKDINHFTVHESFVSEVPLHYRELSELNEEASYSKMMMVDWPEILDEGIKKLPPSLWDKYTVLRSEPHFLEFLNKRASKGTAVKKLAELLKISSENVMAIGDGGNDLDMVQYAGIGVAMGNAVDEVKENAKYVTASNNENGVAEAIHKFIL